MQRILPIAVRIAVQTGPLVAISIENLKTCPERAKRVEWIENIVVPVVQRIERRFPKGKMAFLQESPNDIRSTQLAVFEVVD